MDNIIIKSLNLEESNIDSLDYVYKNNTHFYFLKLVSRGVFCSHCTNSYTKKIHSYKDKHIKHSILIKENIHLIYKQRRYICPKCHKTIVEQSSFTNDNQRITKATINKVLLLAKDYNQTFSSIARAVNLSPTQVMEIFDQYVQIKRKTLQEIICIDELYFSRKSKDKYICMIIGFKNGLILDVLDSRKKSFLKNYFRNIPIEERNKVKFISMDMYDTYRDVAHLYFPHALCCADSFHIVKNIHQSLDKIRIKVMNKFKNNKKSDEYYLLKYKNYLLFKDSLKINETRFNYNRHFKYNLSDSSLLEKILDIDNELKYAYQLKELYMIFNTKIEDRNAKEIQLNTIIDSYKISGIQEFQSIASTLENWKEEILNSFITYNGRRISNGPIESRNKYLDIIKDLANGFRNKARFRNRIMYVFNKHEKPLDEPHDTSLIKLPGVKRGTYNKKNK